MGQLRPAFSQPDTLAADVNLLVLKYSTTSGLPPGNGARSIALAHLAMHDALNAVSPKYPTYLTRRTAPKKSSRQAAVISAAQTMLLQIAPHRAGEIDAEFGALLATVPAGHSRDNGVAVGADVASALFTHRANDGYNVIETYTPGSAVDAYQPTAPNFATPTLVAWGKLQPFVMISGAQFRVPPPPALSSAEWVAEFDEVKAKGFFDSPNRTPEETELGRFMYESEHTFWHRLTRSLIAQHGFKLHDSVRTLTLVAVTMGDASISWAEGKYTYNRWRPITAIRAADTDGNDATSPDATWLTDGWTNGPGGRTVTPPHPDYPSAHGVVGGASSRVLAGIFGDEVDFTVTSVSLPGVTRSYDRLSTLGREFGLSRIYVGYHFRSAVETAYESGRQLAEFVLASPFSYDDDDYSDTDSDD